MKILVTGGTGFIGSHLVKSLQANYDVIVLGRTKETTPLNDVKYVYCDCLGSVNYKRIGQVDVCFHQAANNDTTDMDSVGMVEANVLNPAFMFERLADLGCERFIYASSTAVYGNLEPPYREDMGVAPTTPYGCSKALFDEFAMRFGEARGATVVGLRYCNVYGPDEEHKGKRASMVYQMWREMLKGHSPKLFEDGSQRRDWCYIDDVVGANLTALNYNGPPNVFNIGSGAAFSFNEIVRIWNLLLKSNVQPLWMHNYLGNRFQNFTLCDLTKTKSLLGWSPRYLLQQGMEEMERVRNGE